MGRDDKYLPACADELRRLLARTQQSFLHDTCRFSTGQLRELALLIVEFAEDIHNQIGLWSTLESFNRATFGELFPLTSRGGEAPTGFDPRRLRHLLWGVFRCFKPEIMLSPTHTDLVHLADAVSRCLAERFVGLPSDSGVKKFLGGANRYGWEVKRKLIWIGTHSYLFRHLFAAYVSDHDDKLDVGTTDDFVCQQCTLWSGLGVVDILTGALEISEADRADLRSWYERHAALFRVESRQDSTGETKTLVVLNLINNRPYTVRMDVPQCPFQPGNVVFGSLVPWRGEWYWSGEQKRWQDMPPEGIAEFRQNMLQRHPSIVYRYCPDLLSKAQESVGKHHARFVAHYGDDLAVFPNGLALAAAEQKRIEADWQAAPAETVARLMDKLGLKRPCPPMKFPRSFLDHEEGIGAFFNRREGQEYMLGFNHVLAGFRKRGVGLIDDERQAIQHFMEDGAISMAFVLRLVRDHGAESIAATYLIRDFQGQADLDYLLRRHKGQFHRTRYPALSLAENDG